MIFKILLIAIILCIPVTAFTSTIDCSEKDFSPVKFYRLDNYPDSQIIQNFKIKKRLKSFESEEKKESDKKAKNKDILFKTGPVSNTINRIKKTGTELKKAIIGDNVFLNKTAHNAYALYKRISFNRKGNGIDNKMDSKEKIDQIYAPETFFKGRKKGFRNPKEDKETGLYYNLNW